MKFIYCIGSFLIFVTFSVLANPVSLIDPQAIDYRTKPCDDFYQYSCGNWIKNTVLPPDQSIWDRGFNSGMPEKTRQKLQRILESYSKGNYVPAVPYAKKLGDFYSSCMDEAGIEKTSQTDLTKQLKLMDKIHTLSDLPMAVANLHLKQVNVLFNFYSAADLLNPKMQIGKLSQGGLGLPNVTYYTSRDPATLAILKKYQDYVTQLFELAGYSHVIALANMKIVLSIETRLARDQLPPQDLHDLSKLYHPMSIEQLQSKVKSFNFLNYFKALSISPPKFINVEEPNFLTAIHAVLKQYSINDLKIYFKWKLLQNLAPNLSNQYVNAFFEFEQQYLSGQKTIAPRSKQCAQIVGNYMGNPLGHAYVKQYFDPNSKKIALSMMKNIMKAFEVDLRKANWLDDQTRQAALKKLSLMKVRVGYPDKWRSYDALTINKSSFLENVLNVGTFNKKWELKKIGNKTDPNEFSEDPQVIDAAYIPTTNSIEVLAGILQAPYFSEQANEAQNYGGIGVVMGHELTHGFDTSGRRFDAYGAMKDWWTKETELRYLNKVKCLENQYSNYEILPGLHVNGTLTITENIADAGGIKLAYAAYKMTVPSTFIKKMQDGFTNDQQFYLTFSQGFCAKATKEYWKKNINDNPHSPPRFRVNGVIVDDVNFPVVFKCPEGSCPMAPVKRCEIW